MKLENLKSFNEIKRLDLEELEKLYCQIKEEIIKSVSKNGGHLSSNLGTIKLILALFKVFDLEKDRVIFDIGHQAYTYKILTGRLNEFKNNRNKNGTQAFPSLEESKYDFSSPGHAGTSLSISQGYTISDIINENNDTLNITIIGDGSLTNGITHEALNIQNLISKKQIIILNNNQISISENVGAVADEVNKIAKIKKNKFLYYNISMLGPVDGNNIKDLIKAYQKAKKSKKTVLINVLTKKGQGYKKAELEPSKYHGISNKDSSSKESFSEMAAKCVYSLLEKKNKTLIITPAMIIGSKLEKIKSDFPNSILDVGIAEENAVSLASGISLGGIKPIIFIYSTFLQRSIDQIINDIYLQKQKALFIVDRCGIVQGDGQTHQGIYDLALLKVFQGLKILNPINFNELQNMIEEEFKSENASFIRIPKISNILENYNYEKVKNFRFFEKNKDKDIKVIALSPTLIKNIVSVREKLNEINIDFDIICPFELRKLDEEDIKIFKNTKKIIIFEEFIENGGFSEILNDSYIDKENKPVITKHQINKKIPSLNYEDIMKLLNFDEKSIYETIKREI